MLAVHIIFINNILSELVEHVLVFEDFLYVRVYVLQHCSLTRIYTNMSTCSKNGSLKPVGDGFILYSLFHLCASLSNYFPLNVLQALPTRSAKGMTLIIDNSGLIMLSNVLDNIIIQCYIMQKLECYLCSNE